MTIASFIADQARPRWATNRGVDVLHNNQILRAYLRVRRRIAPGRPGLSNCFEAHSSTRRSRSGYSRKPTGFPLPFEDGHGLALFCYQLLTSRVARWMWSTVSSLAHKTVYPIGAVRTVVWGPCRGMRYRIFSGYGHVGWERTLHPTAKRRV
jgi:hypothetical protein